MVNPGDLFLAYPGDAVDGRRYIDDAIARGAAAVLWERGYDTAAPSVPGSPSVACVRSLAASRMPSSANRASACR